MKLVPDPSGGGATCVRATELTDEELEAMLYRLHRVRRRRASEAAAANPTQPPGDSTVVRLIVTSVYCASNIPMLSCRGRKSCLVLSLTIFTPKFGCIVNSSSPSVTVLKTVTDGD